MNSILQRTTTALDKDQLLRLRRQTNDNLSVARPESSREELYAVSLTTIRIVRDCHTCQLDCYTCQIPQILTYAPDGKPSPLIALGVEDVLCSAGESGFSAPLRA